MVRVLQIVSSLTASSGVANFLMDYYRNLNKDKVQFDFAYFKFADEAYIDEVKKLGGRVFKISDPREKKSKKSYNTFFKQHRNEFAIVHFHPIFCSFFFGRAAKENGIKHTIQHSHTTKYGNTAISHFRNRILFLASLRFIDAYAGCSKDALALIPKRELKKKGGKIFYNAIDFKRFHFNSKTRSLVRSQLNIDKEDFVLGHIGRFSPEKNHLFLIQLFSEFNKLFPHSKLILVGDGPLKNKVQNLSDKLGVSRNIRFLGNRKDVEEIYCALDVLVLPSTFEGLGIVAIEAQASGVPALCSSRVPDAAKISSLFSKFPLGNYDAAIKKLKTLYSTKNQNIHSPNLLSTASNYDIKKQAHKLEDFYIRLAGVELSKQ